MKYSKLFEEVSQCGFIKEYTNQSRIQCEKNNIARKNNNLLWNIEDTICDNSTPNDRYNDK